MTVWSEFFFIYTVLDVLNKKLLHIRRPNVIKELKWSLTVLVTYTIDTVILHF